MKLGLEGRVAVITGSAGGIGAEIARALAEEGCRIVITDIRAEGAERMAHQLVDAGHEAIGVAADVCAEADVEALVAATLQAFGTVDILVNNAGFVRDGYIAKMQEADWSAVVDTILKGAFLCSRAVMPTLIEKRHGRIVNITSRAHLGNPGQTNYSAAKAGLIGFTRALALESGKYGITANAVAPGVIDTDAVRALPHYERVRDNAAERASIKRIGEPRDVANAVVFLASDAASYITGDLLHVTGGRYA